MCAMCDLCVSEQEGPSGTSHHIWQVTTPHPQTLGKFLAPVMGVNFRDCDTCQVQPVFSP